MIARFIPGPRDLAAYLYKIRFFLIAVVLLMTFAFLVGAGFALALPGPTQDFIQTIAGQFGDMTDQSGLDLMGSLFLHNALICALMAVLGLAFGVITLFIVFDNGLVIGLVGAAAADRVGLVLALAAILPHGIFELPAMMVSAAIGLYLGYCLLMALFQRPVNMAKELGESAGVFVFWVIPTLFVAAFMESFVTTALINFLQH